MPPPIPTFEFEQELRALGYMSIAGTDEAGRGPLAGPVVAAAVILRIGDVPDGIRDSKLLSPAQRKELFEQISLRAVAHGVGVVGNERIDEINILRASVEAMHLAIERLYPIPDMVLADGNSFRSDRYAFRNIIKGDQRSFSVAAASILAKVTRDTLMRKYAEMYPEYGFDRHKGYPTAFHREAVRRLGPCAIHRKTFLRKLLLDCNIENI